MKRITAVEAYSWTQTKRLHRALVGWVLAGAWALGTPGCGPPVGNTLLDTNGQPIRLTAITRIIDDADLTDSEKREQLQGLGIQDEALIDLLMQQASEPSPF